MGLQRFERRLERLVEGTFSKAFRSGLQPVEIGRRIVRDMDAGRTLGVRGTIVPNDFTVELSSDDMDRFAGFADALAQELVDAVREHAREERYAFEGPVAVHLVLDEHARRGDLRIATQFVAGAIPAIGSVVLPDGKRVALGESTAVIGRMPECAVTLSDPQSSRQHAEIRHNETGYRIVDLGSTNGTEVNGVRIKEMPLTDGDVIVIGATSLRFEES
jgi:Protein of unknown function (DUF3662)/FHA domain